MKTVFKILGLAKEMMSIFPRMFSYFMDLFIYCKNIIQCSLGKV